MRTRVPSRHHLSTSSATLAFEHVSDVREFERRAGEFLRAREAEHCLMLGICSNLREATAPPEHAPYFAVVTSRGETVAAALRTPPFNLVLSHIEDDRAVDLIADDVFGSGADLPGALGKKRTARRFAERWSALTAHPHRVNRAERIFQLERVIPPRPASGSLRLARPRDRDLVAKWLVAFSEEAQPGNDTSRLAATAERWIARQAFYVWDDGGVVSMCSVSGRTPDGIRVGAVYTPPELRGRGYASNCVAAVSQAQLDAGLRFCFLFTDLANPTSNKIYKQMGYEPVCDMDEYAFTSPGA